MSSVKDSLHTQPASGAVPVRVEPLNIVLYCHSNEALIQCAWRSGYYWPTICGGLGDCGTCRCELIEGAENAASMSVVEGLFFSAHPDISSALRPVRLACCMTVNGPMTIFKQGVRPR